MKKSIVNVLMFVGFIVVVVGLLIGGISDEMSAAYVLTNAFNLPYLATVLAVCFIGAKNGVVKNVGYALAAVAGVYGIVLITTETMVVAAVGMILMLLAALGYVITLILAYFGFVKSEAQASASTASISTLLGKYKEMEAEKVITEEEFCQLKANALQTLSEKENVSLEDLKKWKKLLDQKVINEEEFAQLKGKVFTK